MIYIGIDTGVNTGLAVWDSDCKAFSLIDTMPIHRALSLVESLHHEQADERREVFVIFEDARQRKWLPTERSISEQRGRLQGAGSVKRDAGIWEDFLNDYCIPYRAVPPAKGLTKWDANTFKAITKWQGRTSNHARDAAMLVFGK